MSVNTDVEWGDLLDTLPETVQFDLLPPDTYTVKVEEAKAGVSQKGNGKIELTLVVTEGPHKGRKLWSRINFAKDSQKSMAITVDQLAQFGISRTWLATNNPKNEQIALKLIGVTITVRVSHREWESKMYHEVRGFKAVAASSDPF